MMKHDTNALCQRLYSKAKLSWEISLIGRLILIAAGTLSLWTAFSRILPFIIFLCALLSEVLLLRSDYYKGKAEALRRKLDFKHSFGWDIPKSEIADILGSASPSLKRTIELESECDSYFANSDGDLPTRAMNNVEESAWWNKLLANKMVFYVSVVTTVALVGSLGSLILTLGNVTSLDTLSNIGRVVTSVLMMILSLGLVRLALAYYNFQQKSEKSEERARNLLAMAELTEIEAIKVYSEFHIDRATAPLIPDWLYRRHRNHFNEVWRDRS